MTHDETVGAGTPAPTGTSRRGFLSASGLSLAAIGLASGAAGTALGLAVAPTGSPDAQGGATGTAVPPDCPPGAAPHGNRIVPFHGDYQAGVTAVPGAFASFVALDLLEDTTRERQRAWMKLLTDDIARLTSGKAALADVEHELAATPAGLTVTLGYGKRFVERAGGSVPAWLGDLPAFSTDALDDRYCGGDVLVLVQSDDPLTLAHCLRMLLRDSRSFATQRWRQDGFRRARGTDPEGKTMRNLFGQVDGTANARPGTADFDAAVPVGPEAPAWLQGGTSFVLRRIAMDLDGWDAVDRKGRENAVGRRLSDGAPLTGDAETDPLDLDALGPHGLPVIAAAAHARRAFVADPAKRIVRLGYSYQEPPSDASRLSDSGLLFGSWQADVTAQFVPIQAALAEADLMNTWTRTVGSAVFAVPPGCSEGGYIGEALLG